MLPRGRPGCTWSGGSVSLRDLLDLVLPAECAACRAPGAPWCVRCERALEGTRFPEGPRLVQPDPVPAGLPPVHAWGVYAGPLRPAVTAWKDEGRGDLRPLLAERLRAAMDAAVRAAGWASDPVLVVAVPCSPTSLRRRGEAPLARLASETLRWPGASTGLRAGPQALAVRRRVADQAGLGAAGRAENLRQALEVPERWVPVVRDRRCLLVDDLITTGATLAEAARALREAGSSAVAAATIAATQRLGGPPIGAAA